MVTSLIISKYNKADADRRLAALDSVLQHFSDKCSTATSAPSRCVSEQDLQNRVARRDVELGWTSEAG